MSLWRLNTLYVLLPQLLDSSLRCLQNPTPIESQNDGNNSDWAAVPVYSAELCIVQDKLRCGTHACPSKWCYMTPENPDEHIKLGYEEICLWARSIVGYRSFQL